jgi:hypothetical protein
MPLLLAFLIPLVIVFIALVRAYGEVDTRFVEGWARAHALTLTRENQLMVRWYLRNARVLRTWGVLAGLFLPSLVTVALGGGDGARVPQNPAWIFLGYLVGALYAELSLVRPVDPRRRAASLVPRELGDYLPRRLLLAQRFVGLLTLAAGIAVALVPYRDHSFEVDRVMGAVVAVAAVALAVGLERLEAWLVQRPQPFASPALVAADDAIRSQSVHSLAGSGLAVLLLAFSYLSFTLAMSDIQLLRWTMWQPAIAAWLLAIVACLYYGHRAWRVRHDVAVPVVPA